MRRGDGGGRRQWTFRQPRLHQHRGCANAGGAFSPFGDITTLMVWQKGIVHFWTFFALFIPAVVNYLVPALIMHFAVPNLKPQASGEEVLMLRGGRRLIGLFLATIVTAVSFHHFLHIPPVIGMLTGLGLIGYLSHASELMYTGCARRPGTDRMNSLSPLFLPGVVMAGISSGFSLPISLDPAPGPASRFSLYGNGSSPDRTGPDWRVRALLRLVCL